MYVYVRSVRGRGLVLGVRTCSVLAYGSDMYMFINTNVWTHLRQVLYALITFTSTCSKGAPLCLTYIYVHT